MMTWQEAIEECDRIEKTTRKPNRKYFESSGYSDEQYREALRSYSNTIYDAEDVVKMAMLRDVGLDKHPKAYKAWDMAYDRGHSSGWNAIYYELCELADLLLGDG